MLIPLFEVLGNHCSRTSNGRINPVKYAYAYSDPSSINEPDAHKRTQGASTIASFLTTNSKVPKFRRAKK